MGCSLSRRGIFWYLWWCALKNIILVISSITSWPLCAINYLWDNSRKNRPWNWLIDYYGFLGSGFRTHCLSYLDWSGGNYWLHHQHPIIFGIFLKGGHFWENFCCGVGSNALTPELVVFMSTPQCVLHKDPSVACCYVHCDPCVWGCINICPAVHLVVRFVVFPILVCLVGETTEHVIACGLLTHGNWFLSSMHLAKGMVWCVEDFSWGAFWSQESAGPSWIKGSTVAGRREMLLLSNLCTMRCPLIVWTSLFLSLRFSQFGQAIPHYVCVVGFLHLL